MAWSELLSMFNSTWTEFKHQSCFKHIWYGQLEECEELFVKVDKNYQNRIVPLKDISDMLFLWLTTAASSVLTQENRFLQAILHFSILKVGLEVFTVIFRATSNVGKVLWGPRTDDIVCEQDRTFLEQTAFLVEQKKEDNVSLIAVKSVGILKGGGYHIKELEYSCNSESFLPQVIWCQEDTGLSSGPGKPNQMLLFQIGPSFWGSGLLRGLPPTAPVALE